MPALLAAPQFDIKTHLNIMSGTLNKFLFSTAQFQFNPVASF
jgi:hypothetical protein